MAITSASTRHVAMTAVSTLAIHPHYLSHFNLASGGADREPPRLIDSNLDWGQDLVGLRDWMKAHPEEGPAGLVYFGQIPPQVFNARGEGFPWFLPPARPGLFGPLADFKAPIRQAAIENQLVGPTDSVVPGLYAVSATMRQGLSWRVYDPSLKVFGGVWRAEDHAY